MRQPRHEVHEQDREQSAAEEVRGRRRQGDRAQVRVANDEACALDDLTGQVGDASPASGDNRSRALVADRCKERARREKGERISDERERSTRQLDQEAGKARPDDLCSGAAQLELRVAVDELMA